MKIEETELKNGAKIIGINKPEAKSVAIFFGFKVGSRSETLKILGTSHFIEHMMFKGSKKYPSAKILAEKADALGASWNAFTDKEMTIYHIWTASENFDLALDLVGDMVTRPLFVEQEIKKEAGTIIQEINMYEDIPMYNMETEMIYEIVYGDTPLGRNIGGTKETVAKTTKKDIEKYYNNFYNGENLVVVLVGKLPHDFKDKIKEYASRFDKGKKNQVYKVGFSKKDKLSIREKKTDQSHIGVAVPAFNWGNRKAPAASIIATILGGYMSSRLFTEIREKRGWAYYIHGEYRAMSDTGFLTFFGGIKNKSAFEAIELIKKELINFPETIVEEEIERAKGHIRGIRELRYENPASLASYIGSQFLTKGSYELPPKALMKLEKVKKKEIVNISKELFKKDQIRLAAIGPFKDEAKFAKILQR